MKRGPVITGIPERGRARKNQKVGFRVSPEDKALLERAAASEDLDPAVFIRKAALRVAREVTAKDGQPVEIKS